MSFFVHHFSCLVAPLVNKIFLQNTSGLQNIPEVGPYILACNHIGFPDALVLSALIFQRDRRLIHFIARDDYWFAKWWVKIISKMFGALLIDWRQPRAVLDQAKNFLANKESIIIFPEGTRNFDQQSLLLGKTGVARLALEARMPIIPIGYQGPVIRNIKDVIKCLMLRSQRVKINIGQPLNFSQYYNQTINRDLLYKITDKIMVAIGALCRRRPRLHEYL